jgi:chromosome partitioning protein
MTLQDTGGRCRESGGEGAFEHPARDEHPSVVLHDLATRRRPEAHVIAFANEKGGVGKSTLAFHCALALAHLGERVLTLDCDRRQQTLHRLFEARDGTMRTLKADLPRVTHTVLDKQSGALLLQEIERLGHGCDFVLIDLAGHDSPIARRAIALADTVVTPVNCSSADIDALGRINAVSHRLRHAGPFAEVVIALRAERVARGLEPFDWVVAKNRVRHCEQRLIATADRDLATIGRHLGFRLIAGMTERLAYRELLRFGLSHLDLKLIPGLGRPRSAQSRELQQLVEGLHLPHTEGVRQAVVASPMQRVRVSPGTAESYREALHAAGPVAAAAG